MAIDPSSFIYLRNVLTIIILEICQRFQSIYFGIEYTDLKEYKF